MVKLIRPCLMAAGALAVLLATARYGIHLSMALLAVLLLLYAWLNRYLQKWEYREELKRYAVMIENIYEASRYPGDRQVRRRAEYHRRLLKESQNPEPLKVYELYFQSGEHCNESWEEFLERAELFRLEDRRKHHKKIARESWEWYVDNALRQERP